MNWLKEYDSWTRERIMRHVAYWSAWSLFLVLTNYFIASSHPLWKWTCYELIVLPIKISCSYCIAYYLLPKYLLKRKYFWFVFTALATSFLHGCILYVAYSKVIYPILLGDYKGGTHFLHYFVFKGVELFYIAAVVVGIKFFQKLQHERERNQALKQQKIEAELKYLRNQVQPHFLFNTLNNIYGMVLSQDRSAPEAIIRLSEVLSYMLYDSDVELIALSSEIESLDNFIELERLRYSRKLDVQYRKGIIPHDLYIAPLLLMPFIENAFKHGPAKEEGRSFIRVEIYVEGDILYFTVENSYNKFAVSGDIKSGIGLANVRKRLELLYKDKYSLRIEEGDAFQVHLQIQLDREP